MSTPMNLAIVLAIGAALVLWAILRASWFVPPGRRRHKED